MNGGRRLGAGRKKGSRNAAQLKIIDIAGQVLQDIDAKEKWKALLNCSDPKVVVDVMKYLTDRAHGRPDHIDQNRLSFEFYLFQRGTGRTAHQWLSRHTIGQVRQRGDGDAGVFIQQMFAPEFDPIDKTSAKTLIADDTTVIPADQFRLRRLCHQASMQAGPPRPENLRGCHCGGREKKLWVALGSLRYPCR